MKSEPIHDPSGKRPQPDSNDQTVCLTDEQRAFASVVGHALAEAWRRRWQQDTDDRSISS